MVEIKELPFQYNATEKDSIHTLTYIYQGEQNIDTVRYILKEAQEFDAKLYIKGNHQPDDLSPMLKSTSLMVYGASPLRNKDYKVYKFASNGFSMDACVTHFWVPEFGIILKRNPTWRNMQKLRTNNDSINRDIELLVDLIYQDPDFYRGCETEVPDPLSLIEWENRLLEREKRLLKRHERLLEAEKRQNGSE